MGEDGQLPLVQCSSYHLPGTGSLSGPLPTGLNAARGKRTVPVLYLSIHHKLNLCFQFQVSGVDSTLGMMKMKLGAFKDFALLCRGGEAEELHETYLGHFSANLSVS